MSPLALLATIRAVCKIRVYKTSAIWANIIWRLYFTKPVKINVVTAFKFIYVIRIYHIHASTASKLKKILSIPFKQWDEKKVKICIRLTKLCSREFFAFRAYNVVKFLYRMFFLLNPKNANKKHNISPYS